MNQSAFQFTCTPEVTLVGFHFDAIMPFLEGVYATRIESVGHLSSELVMTAKPNFRWLYLTESTITHRYFVVLKRMETPYEFVTEVKKYGSGSEAYWLATATGVPVAALMAQDHGNIAPYFYNKVAGNRLADDIEIEVQDGTRIVQDYAGLSDQDIFNAFDVTAAEQGDAQFIAYLRNRLEIRRGYYPNFSTGFNYALADDYAINEMMVADVEARMLHDEYPRLPYSAQPWVYEKLTLHTVYVDMPVGYEALDGRNKGNYE